MGFLQDRDQDWKDKQEAGRAIFFQTLCYFFDLVSECQVATFTMEKTLNKLAERYEKDQEAIKNKAETDKATAKSKKTLGLVQLAATHRFCLR